jgi:peptidoglycan hydrolase-like protein with peptidoglycan-binding domain
MAQFEHNSDKYGYINLEELDGVQTALSKLGYDPGKIDGIDGPNTQRAVRDFQTAADIKVDGIVGPQTRQALMDKMDGDVKAESGETGEAGQNA